MFQNLYVAIDWKRMQDEDEDSDDGQMPQGFPGMEQMFGAGAGMGGEDFENFADEVDEEEVEEEVESVEDQTQSTPQADN